MAATAGGSVRAVEPSFTPAHRGGSGEPLVLLHGFTDSWRCWELVLPALEREHDVLAVTLAGHAGGPEIEGEIDDGVLAGAVERAMDEAGFETAHIAGNSLGGFVALQLAERGRARSVTALAPAGGWAEHDEAYRETLAHFATMRELLETAALHADAIVASEAGRRAATSFTSVRFDHIPPDLLAHQIRAAAAAPAVEDLLAYAEREGWSLDPERIACPLRIVWGHDDRLLQWPSAAARFRDEWFPNAEWVELEGVGHCPQLDVPLETAQLILGITATAPR
jgi:pimeloyl-ACP methyl ester carboxylesterase